MACAKTDNGCACANPEQSFVIMIAETTSAEVGAVAAVAAAERTFGVAMHEDLVVALDGSCPMTTRSRRVGVLVQGRLTIPPWARRTRGDGTRDRGARGTSRERRTNDLVQGIRDRGVALPGGALIPKGCVRACVARAAVAYQMPKCKARLDRLADRRLTRSRRSLAVRLTSPPIMPRWCPAALLVH